MTDQLPELLAEDLVARTSRRERQIVVVDEMPVVLEDALRPRKHVELDPSGLAPLKFWGVIFVLL